MKINTLRPFALSACLALTGASCGNEASSELRFEQGIQSVPGGNVRANILNNAGVNIIFLGSNTDAIELDSSLRDGYDAIKDASPVLLDEVTTTFTNATKGLYVPDNVTFVIAELSDESCIDATSEQELRAVHDDAEEYLKEDAVNVIVADALFCDKSANIPGKTTPGLPALLTAVASHDFSDILVHEVGHSAGLGHAGELLCKHPESLDSCDAYPAIDYLSIMGYRDGQFFTNIELSSIGLIGEDAILHDPMPGEYVLRDADQEGSGPQGVVIDTDNEQLFISWERDWLSEDKSRSLQIRTLDNDGRVFEPYLVTGDPYYSSISQSSERIMTPNSEVYSNGDFIVTYIETNENGEAVVKLEVNK